MRSIVFAGLALAALAVAASPAPAASPFRGSAFELVDSDRALLDAAAQSLYLAETVAVGTVVRWENPETGSRGTVTLIAIHEYQGMPCRRLQHDIELRRIRDPYRFVVDRCRTSDGEWMIATP